VLWRRSGRSETKGEGDRDDVLRVVDSGLSVFKTLRGMPKTKFVVSHPGVSVYADAEGNDERPGVKAVIVEKISSGGLVRTKHVLPTTRTHFREGMEVAWEWNNKAVWGESWYLDPETGKFEYAWTESMEFVGRDLDRLMLRSDMPAEQ
jgi:hypothetical protein